MKQWLVKPFLFSVTLFSIDNLADINLDFGSTEGDNTMRSLTVLLQRSLTEFDRAFRLEGGTFAVFSTNVTRKLAIEHANAFKNIVSESELFIVPTTISMGLFHADDLAGLKTEDASTVQQIVVQTARFRLRLAKKRGRNSFVYDSSQTTGTQAVYSVLLIDFPGIQRDLIQRALERSRYHVSVTSDGLAARKAIEENSFDIIVSELMIPKLGALTLRKELLKIPARKRIPFILMSANKNEDTVRRALNLGISHFLVRPVLMVELVGIIDQFAAQAAVREGF
ncbi:MAG: response regulator [Spirochaetales bacterium]|nr:response regulator [Spirochaetales bacterium]